MATPKTAKVPTSVTHYSDLDLSSQHITSSNFMEFGVAKAMELVPKQTIDIDMRTFVRFAPMPIPTYGNADVHNRAFFVPYRTIMKGWNEFIEDTTLIDTSGDSIIPVVPRLYVSNLLDMFVSRDFSQTTTDSVYDFQYIDSAGAVQNRIFTALGKLSYKILCSLGYRIPFDRRSAGSFVISALPLLALMRVYFDWYFPSAYVDDAVANSIRRYIEYHATDVVSDFASAMDGQTLSEIFYVLSRVCYDSDYFVSAWDNPVSPTTGSFSDVSVLDITHKGEPDTPVSISNARSLNGTPTINRTTSGLNGLYQISQFAIDALKSLSDYQKRHQLSGGRVLDRYLSRWGVKLPDANLNRSSYIGYSSTKVRFGDVTSTADTNGENLGAYAGKGIADNVGENFVHFSTDEFGMLIIVSTIVPKTAYYQGIDKMATHVNLFDFYTAEFDNLGVQALETRELYVPVGDYSQQDEVEGIDYDSAVFGFVPRYGEYKRGYDNMTGDLVLGSKNVGLKGWSLMRDVSQRFSNGAYSSIVHDENFVRGSDSYQYNRIFYNTDSIEDKFYVIHNFNIKSRFPAKSLYDSYEFREEDKAQKVNVDINGVRAN